MPDKKKKPITVSISVRVTQEKKEEIEKKAEDQSKRLGYKITISDIINKALNKI